VAATRLVLAAALCAPLLAQAVTLPVERGDAMYHRYDGGGVTIDGPAVLVRKNFKETVSVSGHYYVDNVSSASIDVVTSGASEYSEQRTEYSVGGDYLYGKSILSGAFTISDESDYDAQTWFVGVSNDFFGDLTNLSFGYARGDDEVRQNGNDEFEEEIDRHNYRFGLSQILTPKLIMAFNYEAITDEGYLNNPYRSYRYLNDPLDPAAGFSFSQEVYPDTRTSDAASLKFKYHLPYRATLGGEYRYFTDDWGIDAHTGQINYTHPLFKYFIIDVKYRYYEQNAADFYSDLFLAPSQDEKDYRARDKELSEFSSNTFSLYLTYERPLNYRFTDRIALSLQWDRIYFDYDNFSDLRDTEALPGEEKLYDLDADVIKALFTLWY
jgi:hypothetical protein